jgi:hypothetical protein
MRQRVAPNISQLNRILLYCLARLARAAVVEHNDCVVAGELPYLMKFPGPVVEACDAAKKKRRAIAVNFVVNLVAPFFK